MSNLILILIGALSAYGQAPTDGTIEYRRQAGQIDHADYDFFAAVPYCEHIGKPARLTAGGDVYHGIVFDCAGDPASYDWMGCRASDNAAHHCTVALEVDYYFWAANPELVGSLVTLEILNHGEIYGNSKDITARRYTLTGRAGVAPNER